MAKSGANYGYYWQFNMPNSLYEFQLVMIPSESSTISISSYLLQDNRQIKEAKLSYEYDKLPFGSINPTLELTIDLNKCSAGLEKLLINPNYDNSLSLFSGVFAETYEFRHGNYFDLRMKLKATGDFVSVWQGVSSDFEVEIENAIIKITIESLFKIITSNINIDLASRVYTNGLGESSGQFYDYAFRFTPTTGTPYYIYSDLGWSMNPKYYGWTSKLSDLNSYWQTICSYFKAKITRNTDSDFTLDVFSVYGNGMFTQLFDGSMDADNYSNFVATNTNQRLTQSDLYIVTHLSQYEYSARTTTDGYNSVKNNVAGGFFYQLKQSYETLWDFITEFSESSMTKMYCYGSSYGLGKFVPYVSSPLDFQTTGNLYNIKVTLNYEVLKEVSSQYLDDTARNTKEFKSNYLGNNRNNNAYTLQHALSTKAIYPDEKTFEQRLGSGEYLSYTNQINNNQIYYKPSIGDIKDSAGVALGRSGFYLKVANIPNPYLYDTTVELIDYYDPTYFPLSDYSELKETDSDAPNNAIAFATTLRKLFGIDKQNKIAFDIEFDRFFNTVSSVNHSLVFAQQYGYFLFQLSRVRSNWTDFSIYYVPQKVELDLITLMVNCEAVSRGF